MAESAAATPFPLPDSDAGRVLAHLVTHEIPGVTIETDLETVAQAAGLAAAATERALDRLSAGGLISVDTPPPGVESAGGSLNVTVLIAPPHDEFGIRPRWGGGTTVPPPISGAVQPAGATESRRPAETDGATVTAAESAPAGAAPGAPAPSRRKRAPRDATPAGVPRTLPLAPPVAAAQPLPISLPPEDGAPSPTQLAAAPARGTRAAGRDGAAGRAPRPASVPAQAAARASDAGTGVAVDETALVRGFLERFERLLGESDEQRKRAQQAEDRAAALEKQLRAAEKRAEAAEAKLEAAQERLRTWAELTRRMQHLSRQADGRARPSRPKAEAP